jgi:hypothetical protein
MTDISYVHIVEYESSTNKVVIYRLMSSGKKHLYTEIPIAEIATQRRNLEGLGRILGEALVLDICQLREKIA